MNFSRLTAMKPHIPETRGLLRDWIIACFKAFGFMIPLIFLLMIAVKWNVPNYIAAGLFAVASATILGFKQWQVISQIWPNVRMDRWIAATVISTLLWALFRVFWRPMIAENFGVVWAVFIQLSLGGSSIYFLGLLQALVLRKHTSQWGQWARAHAFALLLIYLLAITVVVPLALLDVSKGIATFIALPLCLFGFLYLTGRFLVKIARYEAAVSIILQRMEEEENQQQTEASENR